MANGFMTLYMTAGMKATISIPISTSLSVGVFPREGAVDIEGRGSVELIRGFVVQLPTVGTIAATENEALEVVYTHNKNTNNTIYFYGIDPGVMLTYYIDTVAIHDHASVYTGGPAHGTYYTEL